MRTLLLILLTLLAFPAFSAPFTKIANNGADLPDSALLGSGPDDWACTRDNAKWKIWEVKTADGGLRDMNKTYSNYTDPNSEQMGGHARPTQAEIDAASNSIGFLKAVNSTALCGASDWGMPDVDDLRYLAVQSSSPNNDPPFFPNTTSAEYHYYWSLSPYWGPIPSPFSTSQYPNLAMSWSTATNHVFGNDRGNHEHVRLMRNGLSSGTFGLALDATGSGSGTLSSNTGRLDCASTAGARSGACAASLASGTSVTLTATPASGSTFVGWSGACTGTGSCVVTLNATTTVSAQFDPAPFVVSTNLQIVATRASLETRIAFNSGDIDQAGVVFVTARVPASALGALPMAPTSKLAADPSGQVTIQLTADGWVLTEKNDPLLPYASGALSDPLAVQKILADTDTEHLPGAQFCVGYGASAVEMLNANRLQVVATLPGGGMAASGSCLDVHIRGQAIEFYHSALKHYFYTIDPNEAAGIDAGAAGAGWARTGGTFNVYPTPARGTQPVCRFYGSPSPGPNSHFFTISANECAGLRALQASTPESEKKWHYEKTAFYMFTPTIPSCGGTPLYRFYNNGFARGEDSNHRLVDVTYTYGGSMFAAGWIYEGLAMCAP